MDLEVLSNGVRRKPTKCIKSTTILCSKSARCVTYKTTENLFSVPLKTGLLQEAANMLIPLAPSYRRVCVRSSHERDRPPPRGSRPPNPHPEPTLGLEAFRRSDSGSRLLPPYSNKKLKGAKRRLRRKQLRRRTNTAEPQQRTSATFRPGG